MNIKLIIQATILVDFPKINDKPIFISAKFKRFVEKCSKIFFTLSDRWYY
jgi:hypothetical protein